MDEPLQEVDVRALIKQALSEDPPTSSTPAASVQKSSPPPSFLAYQSTDLFNHLHNALIEKLDERQIQEIFTSLRAKMYEQDQLTDPVEAQTRNNIHQSALQQRILSCTACPNLGKNQKLSLFNIVDPDIVIIRTLPYRNTVADELLLNTLKKIGFSSKNLCIIPVVHCAVQTTKELSAFNINECANRYLFDELQSLQPSVIVTSGKVAYDTIFSRAPRRQSNFEDFRGSINWLGPWPFVSTFSPESGLKSDRIAQSIEEDLRVAYQFLYH